MYTLNKRMNKKELESTPEVHHRQIQESVLPILLRRPSAKRVMNKVSKRLESGASKEKCLHGHVDRVEVVAPSRVQIRNAMFSLLLEPYESTYDDFVELWLQFGGKR